MNKMREQFEKWDYETFGEDGYEVNELGEYEDSIKQQCWMAWRASREILGINIPITQFDDGCGDTYDGVCLEDMQQALEEQGVKFK